MSELPPRVETFKRCLNMLMKDAHATICACARVTCARARSQGVHMQRGLNTARVHACTVTGYDAHAVKGMRAGMTCGEASACIEAVSQVCARASECARASNCAHVANMKSHAVRVHRMYIESARVHCSQKCARACTEICCHNLCIS